MNIRALCERSRAVLARLLTFVLAGVLTACGGGGGGDTTATNLAASSASLTITAFTPASGGTGSTITVTGVGFSALQSVKLGAITATFTVASDTQLQLTVPQGAQTGRIELSAAGRSVLSATDFTVSGVPLLLSLSPASVLPGGRVTLNGSSLDRVTQVRLNSTVLPIVSQAAATLTVDVPMAATSGALTLVDADGAARVQSQQLAVVAPMTLTSFAPTSIVTGQNLTVNGTNLDRSTAVLFAGGATASIATRTGTTRITVTVPDAAQSGVLQVQGNAADQVASASALTVVPAIRVNATAVYRVTATGSNVTVVGTGLTEVSGVMVGNVAAALVSRSATQIVFTVPSGVACGAVNLQSTSQPAVAGGSIVVGNGCTATLAGIDFAQVLSQPTTDARQRLVPGKETWVRAYVLSDQTGLASPTVRVTGYRGATILGTLAMAGPATIPVASGGVVPDTVRYAETQSFNAELPAAWVTSGLSVRIEVDPEQRLGSMTTQDATPNVGSLTKVDIVLVPLVSGVFAPTVPSTATVLDELTRRFPIPRDRITVTMRGSYTLSSVTDGLDTSADWSNAVQELEQLRQSENRNRYYFGFVRRSGGGIAGIGYVPGRTAIGWDAANGWARTMSHEVGHNFGRPHAPCGGVADPDPNYPYAGGVLNGTPLVDSIPAALDVISPVNQTDIMGYCNGSWFSDYNYRLMQSYLESQPQADVALAQTASAQSELLLIAGSIGLDGVSLRPVHALRGDSAPALAGGEYTVRLVTRDGRTIEQGFDAPLLDHAMPPERHFAIAVLNPGPLERIEVRRGGAVVPLAATTARAQRAQIPSREPMSVDWSESAGQLNLRWNAGSAPFASVTYILNGERTVLALHRQGGTLVADTAALPAGGEFEFSLSDGLNPQLIRVPR